MHLKCYRPTGVPQEFRQKLGCEEESRYRGHIN